MNPPNLLKPSIAKIQCHHASSCCNAVQAAPDMINYFLDILSQCKQFYISFLLKNRKKFIFTFKDPKICPREEFCFLGECRFITQVRNAPFPSVQSETNRLSEERRFLFHRLLPRSYLRSVYFGLQHTKILKINKGKIFFYRSFYS